MTLQQALGVRIAILRQEAELTQVELAERVGVSQVGISLIERGESWPKPETLAKLATALGVTTAELFQNNSGKKTK